MVRRPTITAGSNHAARVASPRPQALPPLDLKRVNEREFDLTLKVPVNMTLMAPFGRWLDSRGIGFTIGPPQRDKDKLVLRFAIADLDGANAVAARWCA